MRCTQCSAQRQLQNLNIHVVKALVFTRGIHTFLLCWIPLPLVLFPFHNSWAGSTWSNLLRALVHRAGTAAATRPTPSSPATTAPVLTRRTEATRDRWQRRAHHVLLSAGDTVLHKSVALRKKPDLDCWWMPRDTLYDNRLQLPFPLYSLQIQ